MANRKSRIQSVIEFPEVAEKVNPQNGEHLQIEIELARTISLLNATLESIADGIVVVDLAGDTVAFNQKFLQMWNLPEELVEPKNTQERLAFLAKQLKTADNFLTRAQELANQPEADGYDILELKDGRIFERYSTPQWLGDKVIGRVWNFRNITEQKQAEKALQQREQQYRNLVETSQDLIWSVDQAGCWTFVNQAARQIYGYEPEEMLGRPFTDFETPEQIEKDMEIFASILAGESIFQYEAQHIRKDGTLVDLSFNAIVLRDEQGNVLGTTGTASDITLRKQAEAKLKASQELLNETQKIAKVGGWELDLKTNELFWTEQVYHIHELPLDYQPNLQEAVNFYAPEYVSVLQEALQKSMTDGEPWDLELEFITGKKNRIWIRAIGQAHLRDGKVVKLSGTFQDINEKKLAEESLRQNETSLATAQRIAHLGNWVSNLQTGHLYWSDEIYRIFGLAPQEFSATVNEFFSRVHPDDLDYVNKAVEDAIAKRKDYNVNHRIVWDNGEIRFVRQEGEITFDEMGNALQMFGIVQDVTERKQLELKIQESLQRRGRQVQLSTEIAQEIAAATNLSDLYGRVVTQIQVQFNYYYTQLLRYDPSENIVKLVVGYGEVGTQMLAQGHNMPVGVGLIGTAAATGKSILRSDITADLDWRSNPLLPDTKGELAVPIKLGEQVLGVLDVQSNVAGQLDADDQLVLEGLCGQVAIAIESTRLRQEMEDHLHELNTLQRLMSREGWEAFKTTREQKAQAYLFDQTSIRVASLAELQLSSNGIAQKGLEDSEPISDGHLVAKPMAVRGEIIGALGIENSGEEPLTVEDQVFLDAVAEQVAEALERARLLEQTRKRAVEMETVAQVSTVASTILDTNKLLQDVADLTKERFGLYHAHIYLLNEPGDTLRLAAGAGEVGRRMVTQRWSIPSGRERSLVARAARTRQGVIVNDVRQESNFMPNPLLPETRAELAVPLLVGDRVLGVLDVQADRVGRFSDDDVQIMTTLASQVGIALQNANQYQQTQAALTETSTMYDLTGKLSRAATLEEALYSIITSTLASDLANAVLFTFDLNAAGQPEWLNLVAIWSRQPEASLPIGSRFDLSEFPSANYWINQPDMVMMVGEILKDTRIDSASRAIYQQMNIQATLNLPLHLGEQWVGLVSLSWTKPQEFTNKDEQLYQAIGAQMSVVVNNLLLIQQTQKTLSDVQQSQELLRATIDATPDWIFIKDRNHRYQLVNKGYADSLHLTPEDLIGKNDLEVGFPEEIVKGNPEKGIRGFWMDDLEVMESGQSKFIEVEPAFIEGQPVFLSTIKVPLRDITGNVWGVLGFVRDITQREQLLDEAENLYEASRRINEASNLQRIVAAVVEELVVPAINRALLLMFERDASGEIESVVVAANWHSGLGTPPTAVGVRYAKATFTILGIFFTANPLFFDDIQHDDRVDPATLALLQRINVQSMAVLPLWVGSRQLGSLLLETEEVYKFTERDIRLNRSLISQAAVAIDNLRLLEETRTALAEVERTQRRYTLQTWEAYRNRLTTLSYEQVREGITPLGDNLLPEISRSIIEQPLTTGDIDLTESSHPSVIRPQFIIDGNQQAKSGSSLIVPLKVRGETVGVLGLQETDEQRDWSPEEIALIEAISEQLAQAAENIRLVEETQQQAAREKRVNEIGEKIRAAQSLEEALKVAVKEVGMSLQAPQTEVKLEVK